MGPRSGWLRVSAPVISATGSAARGAVGTASSMPALGWAAAEGSVIEEGGRPSAGAPAAGPEAIAAARPPAAAAGWAKRDKTSRILIVFMTRCYKLAGRGP